MENYILSLIKENNRVIIPEFGAFIVAKENGFSVLFNNFLSFNDGLLIDYLVQEENISKDEAHDKVSDYVAMVKEALDSVGNYTIKGLGKFTKDATGILRFEQVEKVGEPAADVAKDEELLDISSDDNKEDLKEETSGVDKSALAATKLNDTTPIAEVEEETPQAFVETQIKPDKVEEKKNVKKDPVKVANKYLEEDNKKRNRSITIFVIVFILVPLLGFSIYLLFFKGDSPAETQSKIALEQEVKKEIAEELPTEELGTDDMSGLEAGPETRVENNVKENVGFAPEPVVNKPHHLIVGSFSSEANAQTMISKLKEKGYDQCSSFQHNNRFLVSIESFAKVYEAQARQEEILGDRMESWIMTKRK